MDKKMKQNFLLVAFGIILFAAVMNLKEVLSFLENIVGIFFPLLIGVILAFILSVPMNGIKRFLIKAFSRTRLKPGCGFSEPDFNYLPDYSRRCSGRNSRYSANC